jgi:peroxiredoxin Q/BCP
MKSLSIITLLTMATLNAGAQQALSVGDKAPEFKAVADDGTNWDFKENVGKDYLVIYFFPGAMTSGCTKQACAYRDNQHSLQDVDAAVVGISGDKPENLRLFKQAESLNFTLLSDEKGEIAKAYGVPLGEGTSIKRVVNGNEFELTRGVTAKRWTFIVDKQGKIIYKNDSVNPEQDTREVIAFLKKQG